MLRSPRVLLLVLTSLTTASLFASAPVRYTSTQCVPTRLLSLRGGRGVAGDDGRWGEMLAGSHAQEEERQAGLNGEIELSDQQSLADLVENANGPLRIRCRGPGRFHWQDAAGIDSPHAVDICGEGASYAAGVHDAQRPILAGNWLMMEGSNGSFKNVSLVYRCLVDWQHLETRVDMLVAFVYVDDVATVLSVHTQAHTHTLVHAHMH